MRMYVLTRWTLPSQYPWADTYAYSTSIICANKNRCEHRNEMFIWNGIVFHAITIMFQSIWTIEQTNQLLIILILCQYLRELCKTHAFVVNISELDDRSSAAFRWYLLWLCLKVLRLNWTRFVWLRKPKEYGWVRPRRNHTECVLIFIMIKFIYRIEQIAMLIRMVNSKAEHDLCLAG